MKKNVFIVFLTIILSINSNAQQTDSLSLDEVIKEFYNSKYFTSASWSLYVINTENNKIIKSIDKERALIPASVMKIITTSAALNNLGSDFRYETYLEYTGSIENDSILNGNIIIRGSGDPTFGSQRFGNENYLNAVFDKWLKEIKSKGITFINGSIIADETIYSELTLHPDWIWGDIGNYYGAYVSGLNCNENYYEVSFASGNTIGDTAKVIGIYPEIKNMKYINFVTTSTKYSGDNVYIYGAPNQDLRFFTGTIPSNKSKFIVKGSMPNPALYCVSAFNDYLLKNGILINKTPTTYYLKNHKQFKDTVNRTLIAKHLSPPLKDIVYYTNLKSINLYAESLYKTIGVKLKNSSDLNHTIDALYQYFKTLGINADNIKINDGSGLARTNLVTTEFLATYLQKIMQTHGYDDFYNSLPICGKSGSISGFCRNQFPQGNLRAKSGFMSGVRSYAGYVKNKKNQTIVFAIIINNHSANSQQIKSFIEKLFCAIAYSE